MSASLLPLMDNFTGIMGVKVKELQDLSWPLWSISRKTVVATPQNYAKVACCVIGLQYFGTAHLIKR